MVETLSGILKSIDCGELSAANIGEIVTLNGWVNKRRDHGGLIFADLRDRSGIVQVVFSPEVDESSFEKAESVRGEYVLALRGEVRRRPAGTENESLSTGEIEVYTSELRILNPAKTPPFYITEDVDVDEAVRLKYRYLDLRRPDMQRVMVMRHQTTKAMRDFLDDKGFLEVETPMLTKSTPEGARDYLVPSRLHPGEFFALPQSPQLFKQLLMVSGMERYFQIARCFRDEDLRADRQPEFTQLDIEMSFIDQDKVIDIMEGLVTKVFKEVLGKELSIPFTRLSYHEAMDRYGSDKPDLRFAMELVDATDIAGEVDFKVFATVAKNGGQIKGVNAKGCGSFTRREIDELTEFVGIYGAKGLAWMIVQDEGVKSPIAKFFTEEQLAALVKRLNGEPGDLLLFVADKPAVVADALGHIRLELARRLDLIDKEELNFVWVMDFPLVEYDEAEDRYVAMHHPFTAPLEEDLPLLDDSPEQVRAQAYDLVLNGVELGGGSIRIHRRDIQEKMFSIIGLSEEEAREKFGFLLDAFEYGTPPHGGIAFGLDRWVMLMAGRDTIRDCIAFPKTQSSTDMMTKAPSTVSNKQLKELHLRPGHQGKK
ncbi:aspartate--tRNA ligase [Metallumcola ferriviriculae]|uniref:Aspartate--tRNA(Asp/Asn) ligase n=1 Tax=Metallumcola ferriviriculae TaxID=3039180 RepID=A0AAU0USG3_9FIRM|nr:aspartate--tRNA ligase [Desulfitibacteraceae bacterium MK1]